MFRKVVSCLVIFPLFIVPLFCSCVQRAEAGTVGVEHCHDDEGSHSAKHDDSKADHDHACNCDHALNAALENLTASQVSFSFAHNFFSKTIFLEPISVILLKGSTYLTYLGPPGKASEVPLYIQQHSLRI